MATAPCSYSGLQRQQKDVEMGIWQGNKCMEALNYIQGRCREIAIIIKKIRLWKGHLMLCPFQRVPEARQHMHVCQDWGHYRDLGRPLHQGTWSLSYNKDPKMLMSESWYIDYRNPHTQKEVRCALAAELGWGGAFWSPGDSIISCRWYLPWWIEVLLCSHHSLPCSHSSP